MKGSKTLAKNRYARIFQKDYEEPEDFISTRVFGCLYRRNKRIVLDEASDELEVHGARLLGRVVGLVVLHIQGRAFGTDALSYDLSRRQLLQRTRLFGDDMVFGGKVLAFEINARGSLAYLFRSDPKGEMGPRPGSTYVVGKSDRPGCPSNCPPFPGGGETLDSGEDIDPSSFALNRARTRIYWMKGDQPHSAPLN